MDMYAFWQPATLELYALQFISLT